MGMAFHDDYLNSSSSKGERNDRLFRAVLSAREDGWDEGPIRTDLGGHALGEGLSSSEVRRTIDSAMKRPVELKQDRPRTGPRYLADYWHKEPVAKQPDMPEPRQQWQESDLKRFLTALFRREEYVAYNVQAQPTGDGKYRPSTKGVYTRTVDDLLDEFRPGRTAADVLDAGAHGGWIRLNPMDGQGVADDNVVEYRHCLVESDELAVEEQWRIMRDLNVPCATVVHSGSKSLHFAVKIDAGTNRQLYQQRVADLYDLLNAHGMKVDGQNRNPSRLSRVPGLLRDGQPQYLLATDIGAEDWVSWRNPRKPVDMDRMTGDEPEPLRYIFDGLLPVGVISGVDAQGGIGKGWLTQMLVMSAASGYTLLKSFEPVSDMPVLWIESEDPQDEIHRRFKKIERVHSLPDDAMDRIKRNLTIYAGEAFPLSVNTAGGLRPTEHFEWLMREVQERQPRLIIIDPRNHFYGGDENDNVQVGAFMNMIKGLMTAVKDGAAVWINHHTSKDREELASSSAGRGASAGRDAQRVLFSLTPLRDRDRQELRVDEADAWRYVRFDNTKANWTPRAGRTTYLRRMDGEFGGVFEEVNYKVEVEDRRANEQELCVKIVVAVVRESAAPVTARHMARRGTVQGDELRRRLHEVLGREVGEGKIHELVQLAVDNNFLTIHEEEEDGRGPKSCYLKVTK